VVIVSDSTKLRKLSPAERLKSLNCLVGLCFDEAKLNQFLLPIKQDRYLGLVTMPVTVFAFLALIFHSTFAFNFLCI